MADIGKAIIRVPKAACGEMVEVKSLITHPNDTGLVKDEKTGQLIPAHYVSSCKVEFNGETVYEFSMGPSVSKDPYLAFSIKADKAGTLKMTWKDNKGEVFEQSADINPV
ncbi:MAG: thiosulfate oxidation carrier complex protein SoxZ [Nitrospinae bacterium]|nr:thiosulfate oxidation carrier complex protein SoxZ [Nitrospinota bacterium]